MAGSVTGDVNAVLAKIHKTYGTDVGGYPTDLEASRKCTRVPTGCFAFDLASGGGVPCGRTTIIYGPESSGKTNLALRALANHQKIWPDRTCVFLDIEGAFDPAWAVLFGVDVKSLIVLSPSYAEQGIDMLEGVLLADDIGLVVVDSIAALSTENELASSAEKQIPGGAANVIGRMVRKTTHALIAAKKRGVIPTLVYINQVRSKIGVMYGNPETMSGGHAIRFQAALIVRLSCKDIIDKEIHTAIPVRKQTTAVIKKHKINIDATHCEYEIAVYPHPHLRVGETDDWKVVLGYLRELGAVEKEGTAWVLALPDTESVNYKTLSELGKAYYDSTELQASLKKYVVGALCPVAG